VESNLLDRISGSSTVGHVFAPETRRVDNSEHRWDLLLFQDVHHSHKLIPRKAIFIRPGTI